MTAVVDFVELLGRVFLAKTQLNVASDLLMAFTAVDVALFRSGSLAAVIAAINGAFMRIMSSKMTESLVVALMLVSRSSILRDAVRHSVSYPFLQDAMLSMFPLCRVMRWAGSRIYPLGMQRIAASVTASLLNSSAESWDAFPGAGAQTVDSRLGVVPYWTTAVAEDGCMASVAKTHLVAHACSFLTEQLYWLHEYRQGHRKGLSFRRTLKAHAGSTVFRVVNVSLTCAARMAGAAVGHRLAPSNCCGWFYGQHVAAAAAASTACFISDRIAERIFVLSQHVLPSTAEDAAADVRDEEEAQHEENDAREQHSVSRAAADGGADLYEVLGVVSTATPAEIRKAYRQLALTYHPDKVASEPADVQAEAAKSMAQLNYAYDVLSAADKRRIYDGQRAAQDPPAVLRHVMMLPRALQLVAALSIALSAANLGVLVSYIHLGALFKKFTHLGDLQPR
jgi:hypothetical protein